jgi:hypothetical protein
VPQAAEESTASAPTAHASVRSLLAMSCISHLGNESLWSLVIVAS